MNPYETFQYPVYVAKNGEFLFDILREKSGRALLYGRAVHWFVARMLAFGWSGYWFLHHRPTAKYAGVEIVEAHIGPDSKFVKTIYGHWVRSVTVDEIFSQFGGEVFDLIGAVGSGCDREIWWSDQVQAALPKVYLLEEDGHNEEVIRHAIDRGYKATICNEMLLLVHE